MSRTPALRVPGETWLMLPVPIIGREEQEPDYTQDNNEQESSHLFSLSNRPRINETSETSVFSLL